MYNISSVNNNFDHHLYNYILIDNDTVEKNNYHKLYTHVYNIIM